jgi:hypothetical protein
MGMYIMVRPRRAAAWRPRRPRAVDGVIQAGHQQALGLGFGELVIRILPDVVHAAGWQGHQEAAIFAAADAGTHQIVELEGGIIDGRSGHPPHTCTAGRCGRRIARRKRVDRYLSIGTCSPTRQSDLSESIGLFGARYTGNSPRKAKDLMHPASVVASRQ